VQRAVTDPVFGLVEDFGDSLLGRCAGFLEVGDDLVEEAGVIAAAGFEDEFTG
jgi:hypothetical protein